MIQTQDFAVVPIQNFAHFENYVEIMQKRAEKSLKLNFL